VSGKIEKIMSVHRCDLRFELGFERPNRSGGYTDRKNQVVRVEQDCSTSIGFIVVKEDSGCQVLEKSAIVSISSEFAMIWNAIQIN
jgi:hypothetical protein